MKFILWFDEISKKDINLVGGKNGSLGEMYSNLSSKGVNIPYGFALTTKAYWDFIKRNGFEEKLVDIFSEFNFNDIKSLQKVGKRARGLILSGDFSEEVKKEILEAYKKLSEKYKGGEINVAVRSSAVCEDAIDASFAGQFETYLNISGEQSLLDAIKECYASSFGDRVIAYREEKGYSHLSFALSVCVQKMVRSDLASAGIIFTIDTETGFENVVLINSIYGLGEMIVQGAITPDEFYVYKPTFIPVDKTKESFDSIIIKNLGLKTKKYVYAKDGGIEEEAVDEDDIARFSINDKEILLLAKWACIIEDYYNQPQDIEWAKDGETGEIFIVQSRPETVHADRKKNIYREYQIKTDQKPLLTGIAIGEKVGKGKVQIIKDVSNIVNFKKGNILVTKMTDPNWVPVMRIAGAIVTDEGGKTCFSGDTKILTGKGFLSIKEIGERFEKEEIKVLSLNRETLKLEWKKVLNSFCRKAPLIEVEISQTGRMKNNILKTTMDHKFLTFSNRKLISEKVEDIIQRKKGVISLWKIPSQSTLKFSSKLAYLLGAISSDGHIFLDERHAQIFFIQSPTEDKKDFIKRVQTYFFDEYGYNLHLLKKPTSTGIIRGKQIKGKEAIALKCYKKEIAEDLLNKQKDISKIVLKAEKEVIFNFLAGMIDGDGTYNEKANRINIFCSKKDLLEAISISCLKLGINFQISTNRTIYNIQIVDKVEEILKYTARVKGKYKRERFGTRFFAAKQLLQDIIDRVNYMGRIKLYVQNNLLIDAEKIRNYVVPLIKGQPENHSLTQIINSPLKMLRIGLKNNSLKKEDVYNIEVEDNRNYVVFTSRYTPVVVENCHAAIVSRELGVPSIVGTKIGTKVLKKNQIVTVDCTQGGKGRIFDGDIPFKIKEYNLEGVAKPKTKITMNVGAPDIAFKSSFLPNDGIGLARQEFIVADKIQVHPLALYYYDELEKFTDDANKIKEIRGKIDQITIEHKGDMREYYIYELAEGISQIAAAVYPKQVILRLSDFKTNEYRALIGGELFEKHEENPMMGFRGASRYLDDSFKPAFKMECEAIKRVREVFGLTNLAILIPFCRTIEEGKAVVRLMAEYGLEKGKDDLKIIVMAEIPSNVILADEFLDIFDGMSIGSNDLAQLTLGLDRDNAHIAHIGNEFNPAVMEMIRKIIKACKKRGKYCGICGEAASDPEFAKFLVAEGIEALSVNPDSVIKVTLTIAEAEKNL